ncbi:hypothetical protein FHR32_007883 [Streptosporangium album]|uniref:Uncharacterized protein n=1 Tax=Streptosporangium album TaxID=47479 RepID=A0A7W7WE31_9ACTN|nr:hypothetical protein [Streptosporangium album]MBB4943483.1 hypothetical protein [Streptosporangium album]
MTEADFLRTTRASYDAMAADYAQLFHDDRALLAAFAELVQIAETRTPMSGPSVLIDCSPASMSDTSRPMYPPPTTAALRGCPDSRARGSATPSSRVCTP